MKNAILVMTLAFVAHSFATAATTTTTDTAPIAKKSARAKKAVTSINGEKPSVGTDFKFDDLTVHGQYQSANEGLVTVENDKELSNLLDYRTEYKDRLQASRLNP